MASIGKTIKTLRENAGLTQEELARILGLTRPAVTEIEQGRRRVTSDELVRLSKALHASTDEILGLQAKPTVVLEGTQKQPLKVAGRHDIRISVPQKNAEKFKEVLLYVLSCVGAKPNVGETVLYKLLYFIDFDHYEKYEEQLVGATYQRNHYGPTPIEFGALVDAMIENKELVRIQKPYITFPQKKYLPLRDPDLSKMSARELDLINDVLGRLAHMGAKQISEYSHKDVPWLTTNEGEIISYEAVFYRTPEYSVRIGEEDGNEVP
jgi:transcriptional regulator with XRE-family HTH domain